MRSWSGQKTSEVVTRGSPGWRRISVFMRQLLAAFLAVTALCKSDLPVTNTARTEAQTRGTKPTSREALGNADSLLPHAVITARLARIPMSTIFLFMTSPVVKPVRQTPDLAVLLRHSACQLHSR